MSALAMVTPPTTSNVDHVPWPATVANRYREAGVWAGVTLSTALDEVVARRPDHVAAVCGTKRLSFDELASRSRRVAAGLSARGLRPGDVAILQLPNREAFLVVLLALLRLGVVPVMAQVGHRAHEVRSYASVTRARAHFVASDEPRIDVAELFAAVRVDGWSPLTIDCTQSGAAAAGTVSLDDLDVDRIVPELPLATDRPALLQLSGGSTATPKLIARTHDDYLYSIRRSVTVCGFGPDTVYMAALPAAHNFTLSSPGVLGTLLAGGTVVFCSDPTPRSAFALIERHAVTDTAVVPSLLGLWIEARPRHAKALLDSLRCVQVGGAVLAPELAAAVTPTLGCRLQQVYGMAEGLVCYTRRRDCAALTVQTQGRPMSAYDEVRVVDERGHDVPPGTVGELWTRGPYTVRGYYRAAEHNAVAFTPDGFYRTGDLVVARASGHLTVVGRVKDQVNRGGEKVSAPELEAHLLAHRSVRAAAVVAMPDARLGERTCGFVVTRDAELSLVQMREFLRDRGVAEYKLPDRLVVVADLPLTPVGKVDKQLLRRSLQR